MRKFAPPTVMLISIVLLAVPFTYNSCQGVLGAKGFSSASAQTASCKVMVEGGIVKKFDFAAQKQQGFGAQKVRLKDAGENAGLTQKGTDLLVNAGTELSTILDTVCLAQAESHSEIVSQILKDSEVQANLPTQAFTWELNRTYAANELERIADEDPCVIGVSWNREYTMEAYNDPGLIFQTNLPFVHAEPSYAEFFNANYGMRTTGNSVKVAVLDTGIDWSHPDLAGNIWMNAQGWGVDATTLKTNNVNYNPIDISSIGHGTHISGIIAAISDNSVGVVGVMPHRAQIMAIKVFRTQGNSLTTNSTFVYNGLQYAYQNGASVVNMSLAATSAGANSDAIVEAGIDESVQRGVVVVTVIGNADGTNPAREVDGVNFSSVPGQFGTKEGVITVGSIDTSTGDKSSFSHYSKTFTEIGAPGAEQGATGIYSTLPVTLNSYGRLAGTSQAAPHVAAAAALTIGLIRESYGVVPSPREVERLLLASAIRSPKLINYFKNGGQLDLQMLVQKIQIDYPKTKVASTGPSPLPNMGCP